jgi:hypothetical protein
MLAAYGVQLRFGGKPDLRPVPLEAVLPPPPDRRDEYGTLIGMIDMRGARMLTRFSASSTRATTSGTWSARSRSRRQIPPRPIR